MTFELEGIETDHCVACGGTWLDAGEIEEIVGRSGGDTKKLRAALKAADSPRHGKRKCVRCAATLKPVTYRDVELDRCPYGHGIWFDKGEVVAAVKAETGEVAGFLKEMFKAEFSA